jgi:hypothetical protein
MTMKKNARTLAVALICTVALLGCEALPGAGGGAKTTDQKGALKIEDIVAATMALIGTSQLAGVFVGDPATAFDTTGAALATKIEGAHAKTTTCYTMTRKDATLTLDFKDGCTPPGGAIAVKGTAECTLSVDKAAKTLSVAMKLANFGSGDKTATGTATMSAKISDASADVHFEVDMSAGDAAAKGGMTVKMVTAADKKSFSKVQFDTIDTTTVSVNDKQGVEVKATGVTYEGGNCYPSAGSILVTYAGIKSTIAFDANTKTSGVAKYTPPLSKKTEDKDLLSLGWKCK